MPAGRPPIEITDKMLKETERMAGQGLTKEQIARCLGFSITTLMEKQKQIPEFLESIKKGQAKGLETITNALFKSANEGSNTAQIFYLKNRGPESWKDRVEQKIESTNKIEVEDASIKKLQSSAEGREILEKISKLLREGEQ